MTVAGSGDPLAAEEGPALGVRIPDLRRIALAPDGAIYFTDLFRNRIARIGTDGLVTTIAGTGIAGFTADGALAAAARLLGPQGLAVAADGTVLFAERSSNRIRRITPGGFLLTEAGQPGGLTGSGVPAQAAALPSPNAVAIAPDGALYGSVGDSLVRRISSLWPTFLDREIAVASSDGRLLDVFGATGRHVRRRDALTGAAVFTFSYTAGGHLAAVEDAFGNRTAIERDAEGRPTAIVAPFGQRTALALDANGFLASIVNPAGERASFTYTPDGFLTTMTDPRGATAEYSYSTLGRLSLAEDRGEGSKRLERTTSARGYEVTLTTAMERTTRYLQQDLADGRSAFTVTSPAGVAVSTLTSGNGQVVLSQPTGTTVTSLPGSDPRFGMQAAFNRSVVVRQPVNGAP